MGIPSVTGIIAEYNPYHNGHLYQMLEAKKKTGSQYCVVVLSGHFIQRGEGALYDTFTRAEMALRCGADAVFEMPAPFSSSSARDFALYGISLLSALGVPYVSCGAEDDDEDAINALALILEEESPTFKNALKIGLKNGINYAEARANALAADLMSREVPEETILRMQEILSKPNNILAVEYARVIREMGSPLRLVAVKREGPDHNDGTLNHGFSSATAIRRHLLSGGDIGEVISMIPEPALEPMKYVYPLSPDAFTGSVLRRIIDLQHEGRSLADFQDVSAQLSDRITASARCAPSWEDFVSSVRTKQYTHTRVARALMHIFLGITAENVSRYREAGCASYARLIGFRKDSSELFSVLKESSSIPIIAKMADASDILGHGTAAHDLLLEEAHAAFLWNTVYYDNRGVALPNLYERRMPVI